VTPRRAPESHPYFGTRFRVPDSHRFWRIRASGGDSERNAGRPTAKIERFAIQPKRAAGRALNLSLFREFFEPAQLFRRGSAAVTG